MRKSNLKETLGIALRSCCSESQSLDFNLYFLKSKVSDKPFLKQMCQGN